jgi:hypothetical protein
MGQVFRRVVVPPAAKPVAETTSVVEWHSKHVECGSQCNDWYRHEFARSEPSFFGGGMADLDNGWGAWYSTIQMAERKQRSNAVILNETQQRLYALGVLNSDGSFTAHEQKRLNDLGLLTKDGSFTHPCFHSAAFQFLRSASIERPLD